ncbi:MAG TPA: CoA transferase [Ilumatobacter sp.]|nr:CoA transferase [Ilumatobacter sp.]
MSTEHFTVPAWGLLWGDPTNPAPRPTISPGLHLPSKLDVAGLVAGSVTLAVGATHRAAAARGQLAADPDVVLDGARLTTSVQSDRHFRRSGQPADAWAPLSGFWQAADGWVRTHGNYPHHAERLRSVLGLADNADKQAVAAAIAERSALQMESAGAAAGAVVVAVRSPEQWRAEPHAAAAATQPLVDIQPVGDADARHWGHGSAPLAGIRVLDLTRVIAGPVATRDLAFAGADVLRVDPPQLPEIEWQHLDTGQGKRSVRLDLDIADQCAQLESLLDTADIVVTGYRPGALDRFGLNPHQLAERHPGLVIGTVSAWGTTGPWAHRRGFDSIVQAASGIAMIDSPDGVTPGALPAQALDHAAGHLLAAGTIAALTRQRARGGTWSVSVSLVRIAHQLLTAPPGRSDTEPAPPTLQTGRTPAGEMTVALPALTYRGAPHAYPDLSHPWGSAEPHWLEPDRTDAG